MSLVGDRMRMLRLRSHKTQKDIARVLSSSESAISMYERGEREPSFDQIRILADYFEVTIDDLVGRPRKPTGNTPIEERLRNEGLLTGQKSYEHSDKSPVSNNVDKRNIGVPKVISAIDGGMRAEEHGVPDNIKWIPVLGHIKAGYDLYAEQQVIDVQPVANEVVSDGAEYFYLVVHGDSMSGDGIKEGMRVLVRRQDWVDEGKIGIVLVNGDEATLKRVYVQDNGTVTLVASNSNYPPRSLPVVDAKIQGQVKQVVWDV